MLEGLDRFRYARHTVGEKLDATPRRRRKATYRLYPNATELARLQATLRHHCDVYNAALQERRDAWKRERVSVKKGDQERALTELRREDPTVAGFSAQSQQVTLKRVDLAFQAFFRRVKRGETPGYPRFQSLRRFSGWGYKQHGDGWRLHDGPGVKHGHLRLRGIGERVRIRGRRRFDGVSKTLEILHKAGRWYASVTFVCTPDRAAGTERLGFDWGISHFVTLSTGETVENPRFLKADADKLARLQRDLSRKKRGSRNRNKARRRLARLHERIGRRRHDFLHQTSARLVGRASFLATEKLSPKNMTASTKGTVEHPGTRVRQKAGLNRAILDGAPASFLQMLRYKAEEAGIELEEVCTRTVKPSQRCPECGRLEKKPLAQRWHRCACGCSLSRDHAAALVCLQHASSAGNRPGVEGEVAPPSKHETPSVAFAQVG